MASKTNCKKFPFSLDDYRQELIEQVLAPSVVVPLLLQATPVLWRGGQTLISRIPSLNGLDYFGVDR